jgi:hypothetical protein
MAWAGAEAPPEAVNPREDDLYARLRRQVEWLFSDANLCQDVFLRRLVKSDAAGMVPLATLAAFYRVAALSRNVLTIARALDDSRLLVLSPDRLRVGRVIPFRDLPAGAFDACTIYVERLPLHSHHESIARYFSTWGPVLHVSMPRFRLTRRFKGFAFVQFATPAAAQSALTAHLPPTTAPLTLHSSLSTEDATAATTAPSSPSAAAGTAAPAATSPSSMLVLSKAQWAALKTEAKAAQASLKASATAALWPTALPQPPPVDALDEAAAAAAALALLPPPSPLPAHAPPSSSSSCLVRIRGVPRTAAFRHLRDVVSVPGRPAYIDCPALHGNGVRVPLPCDAAVPTAAASASRRGGGGRGAAAVLAAQLGTTTASDNQGAGDEKEDDGDAPVVVRYCSPGAAAQAVAYFAPPEQQLQSAHSSSSSSSSSTDALPPPLPRVLLGGRPLRAELLTGAEAAAYMAAVEARKAEYQRQRSSLREQLAAAPGSRGSSGRQGPPGSRGGTAGEAGGTGQRPLAIPRRGGGGQQPPATLQLQRRQSEASVGTVGTGSLSGRGGSAASAEPAGGGMGAGAAAATTATADAPPPTAPAAGRRSSSGGPGGGSPDAGGGEMQAGARGEGRGDGGVLRSAGRQRQERSAPRRRRRRSSGESAGNSGGGRRNGDEDGGGDGALGDAGGQDAKAGMKRRRSR